MLENRHGGALRNLLMSVDRLLKETNQDQFFLSTYLQNMKLSVDDKFKNTCVIEIDREWYAKLVRTSQEKAIFLALKQAQEYHFELKEEALITNSKKKSPFWDLTKGRVKEIIKRLDKHQKELKFIIGPLKALTSSKKIMLQFKM